MNEVFRKHRYPTNYLVNVIVDDRRMKGYVIDVNEMGARLTGDLDVDVGQKLYLVAQSHRLPGIIRWVGEDRIGLTFRPMLTMQQLDILRKAVRSSAKPRWNSAQLTEMR